MLQKLILSSEVPRDDIASLRAKDIFPHLQKSLVISFIRSFIFTFMVTTTIVFFCFNLLRDRLWVDTDFIGMFFIILSLGPFVAWSIGRSIKILHTYRMWKDILIFGKPITGTIYGYYTTDIFPLGDSFFLSAPSPDSGGFVRPWRVSYADGYAQYYIIVIEFSDNNGYKHYHASRITSYEYYNPQRYAIESYVTGLIYNNRCLFPYDTKPHFSLEK